MHNSLLFGVAAREFRRKLTNSIPCHPKIIGEWENYFEGRGTCKIARQHDIVETGIQGWAFASSLAWTVKMYLDHAFNVSYRWRASWSFRKSFSYEREKLHCYQLFSHLSLRLRQQGFETNLLQKSFNKFFNRHGLIVVKYGATLWEMRLAIQAWIAPSYPYITYLLLRLVFQLYLGTCAHAILFCARAFLLI